MTVDKSGGPAFPVIYEHQEGTLMGLLSQRHTGMSLRDYFAIRAPSRPSWWLPDRSTTGLNEIQLDCIWAYAYADTMIAERDK